MLGQKTIIVIDDHVELSEAIRAVLDDAGYRADAYTDPLVAITGLSAAPAHDVGLLLVDYCLPGMDGLDFLAAARRLGVTAPAVLVTAVPPSLLDHAALRALNVRSIVSKPFHIDTLLNVVATLTDASLTRHDRP